MDVYDELITLKRGDTRRDEIVRLFGCHHLATAMLRILKIEDPTEKERVTAQIREILDRPQKGADL